MKMSGDTLDKLRSDHLIARKEHNTIESSVLGILISELTRETKDPTEDQVQKGIKKFLKNLKICIAADSDLVNILKHEYAVVSRYETNQLSEGDDSEWQPIVNQILEQNADKELTAKSVGWFVGQTMKATGGKANPAGVKSYLEGFIDE